MIALERYTSQNLREIAQGALHGSRRWRLSDLYEAVTTAEMSVLLQDGLRTILFNSFAGFESTWEQFVPRTTSDREMETWTELGRIGTMQRVGEGEEYRRVRPELLPERQIRNFKYGDILGITEEMLKFDKTNQIRQLAEDQGLRAAQTIEEEVYTSALLATNYSKTSADNDVGNNTSSNAFTPANLITALSTLVTMKDPVSGRYLGVRPDTMIVGPSLEFAARQFLTSPNLQQTGAAVFETANVARDIYGGGTNNPFQGRINRIIVSPYIHQLGASQWSWILCERNRAMQYQEVEPLQILQAAAQSAENEEYLLRDVLRYRVRVWFGVGFIDDRFAYLSESTTAPSMG